jgi:hypothetical protein
VRAPQKNTIAERFVRTTRAETLDWPLILNRRHLQRVPRAYPEHHTQRPHHALKPQPPQPRQPPPTPTLERFLAATASAQTSSTSTTKTPLETRHNHWCPSPWPGTAPRRARRATRRRTARRCGRGASTVLPLTNSTARPPRSPGRTPPARPCSARSGQRAARRRLAADIRRPPALHASPRRPAAANMKRHSRQRVPRSALITSHAWRRPSAAATPGWRIGDATPCLAGVCRCGG